VVALACAWLVGAGRAAEPPRRTSVVLILADDLGYGDLGCYGQKRIQTPNLDQLAAEGIRFANYYAGAPVTAAAYASLMTGREAVRAGAPGSAGWVLRAADQTIADWARAAGYATGLAGGWLLGEPGTSGAPDRKGFEEFVGCVTPSSAHDYYPEYLWRWEGRTGRGTNILVYENVARKRGLYIPDLYCTAAQNFVRIHRPDKFNAFRPFFFTLADPLPGANPEEGRRSGNGMQVPSDSPYSTEPWPAPEKNKAAMITRLDQDVGLILARLKQLRLEEDTLVLFASLNGPHAEGGVNPAFLQSAGPFRGAKGSLAEGGIRVPLIARWTGKIPPGRVCGLPCAAWDLLPTILELIGTGRPAGIDGGSLLPSLLGQSQTNRSAFLYWEIGDDAHLQQAARSGDWKAFRPAPDQPLQLYQLTSDPGEKHDAAADQPALLARFEKFLTHVRAPR